MSNLPFYAFIDVDYTYRQNWGHLPVLKKISFSINPGQMVALMGPSGSGKSTLLHIASFLESPQNGQVFLQGQSCGTFSAKDRTQIRRKKLGFVYQFHHLLPEFNAQENIMLPQLIQGVGKNEAQDRAHELLTLVNLQNKGHVRPACLSGGEQQRVAIARALANEPILLIADEPTGNLDEETSGEVFSLLRIISQKKKMTILMATHNGNLAKQMDRIFVLRAGDLTEG